MKSKRQIFFSWYYLPIAVFSLLSGCNFPREQSSCADKAILSPTEISEVRQHTSDLRITVRELQHWDEIVYNLLNQSPLKRRGDAYRLYAYLYYAQKTFADNSFLITGAYSGSLDSISSEIIRMFYSDFQIKIQKDSFSEKLSSLILLPIQKRYQEEERQLHSIPIKEKEGHWKAKSPVGLHYQTMKPWALKQVDEFKSPDPPPPNSPFWGDQLEMTKEKAKVATEEQKQKGLLWERMLNPEDADWRFIAVKYMNEASIPLEMQLEVRPKIMMALIDALIAVFHDKYTYMVRRPFMLDSSMKTLFTTPNHPSYPAAHGTISGAAETVLSYYFPENQTEWQQLASEARESRLWAGIHFPVDLEVGKKQGEEVGMGVIFR